METIPYDATMHAHRFAVWAAGRAASVQGSRFTVGTLQKLLADAEFGLRLVTPDDLPTPEQLDCQHANWCVWLQTRAKDFGLTLTYGQAAKIINVYLKARFCTGPWLDHPSVTALHPPIDRVLLGSLRKNNFKEKRTDWRTLEMLGWSNFKYEDYVGAIALIRECMNGRPLWEIEEHWAGHQ